MRNLSTLDLIAFVLVIIGAINWGTIGLFDVNLVSMLLGEDGALSKIIYSLVGLSAVYLLLSNIRDTAPNRNHGEPVRTR